MRRIAAVVAVLLAFGVSAAQQSPESDQGEWLQVVDNLDNKELDFIIGPIDLPAGAGHHMVKQPPLVVGTVPLDGYLYGFEVQMLDGQGQPMTQRVLHHVNLIDPDHRELFSPIARRLFAAGGETQAASMPRILGIPIESGQRLMVSAMFHNPTDVSYPGAALKVTLKYRTKGWFFPIGVYPVYIDVMGPLGKKDFDLPEGRFEQSWEGSPMVDGRLLAAGGHLHDHATSLRLEDLTEGKVLWETGPTLDENGRVVGVPVGKFWWKGGIRLKADHVYQRWPALDPNDPDYITNLENTRLTADRRAMGMPAEGGDHGHDAHSHGQ
jgi:hypothetical protein